MPIYLNNTISKENFIEMLQFAFDNNQKFSFMPSGTSMKPMLNGTTDTACLCKKPLVLKKYDVVMYIRRRDNALALHRIVKVEANNFFTMSGDNQYYVDENIHYDDIIAVLCEYTHKGKTFSVDSLNFRVYTYYILLKKKIKKLLLKLRTKKPDSR